METFYTIQKNTQMLIALMKAHNVRKVIVSPGATNVCLVASLQYDGWFEMYSSVDERSAAYMACGLAAECGEPVALSCTGATASRNYMPGLTEAFYRKLPILAITSTQHIGRIGQNFPQVIDRTVPLNDIVRISVQIPQIQSEEDEWAFNVKINTALMELTRNGGGPVHINLETNYSRDFTVQKLPHVRVIKRICQNDKLPGLSGKKIAIYVGNHQPWQQELTAIVDIFCEKYNAVVLCDHTSNYIGKYRVFPMVLVNQERYNCEYKYIDILIDIGNVSGAYMSLVPDYVWRVNPDGEVRDSFKKLQYVFEMDELIFFTKYVEMASGEKGTDYYKGFKYEYDKIIQRIPELPFSNMWIAWQSHKMLPEKCIMHLGILNSLRSWNCFETSRSIMGYSNTGGFGIDGGVSSLVGASLNNPGKLYFGFVGDLAFFYDINSLGNRHIGKNMRIMVINNGKGTEFKNYNHPAAIFGENADYYIAAEGHYGKKSKTLIKNYAENLGFIYLSASSKTGYLEKADIFFSPSYFDKPVLFEVFTDSRDESDAIKIMNNLVTSTKGFAKNIAHNILDDKCIEKIKKFIK